MTSGKKRRHFQGGQSNKFHQASNKQEGTGAKRRRVSDAGRPDQNSDEGRARSNIIKDDGWEVVTSKRSKPRAVAPEEGGDSFSNSDYPRLRFYNNFKGDVQIKDLRDLVLYVLADAVAPNWLAVSNARKIQKVVVLMLPGLDQNLLKQNKELIELMRPDEDQNNAASSAETTKVHEHSTPSDQQMDHSPETSAAQLNTSIARELVTEAEHSKNSGHNLKDWLLPHVLNVRAPGDSRQSRVHSPLQAMLLAQDPEVKHNPSSTNGSSFKPNRIPIMELIHTADELRDAEYPIHPATFTSKADAQLESSRREQTKQSVSHGWVDTKVSESAPQLPKPAREVNDFISQDLKVYSLDCEMVLTSDDVSSLARISLVQYPDGKVILDKYVKPDLPVTNYFTQFSGITAAHLENVTTSLKDIQHQLLELLDSSTILVGHSLESDLNALKLTHPFIIDTAIIYPHPRGLPLRSSLKFLANKYLKRDIQTGGAKGHNSVEDALAVLDLVKQKCDKGLKWGTVEANGEPIFKRLARNARTSAMVEYGTPERGLGKDATWTIGCQNDDEVVQGVIRTMKGDDFFDFEIPLQGVDFVWARLRALEFARGWVSGPGTSSNTNDAQKDDQQDGKGNEYDAGTEAEGEKLTLTLTSTLKRLQQIYDALPERTLLILLSGTSDMRPMLKLQAMQQQYRKEFKSKKWDELTVKWTDNEEQALKQACEDARKGWGAVVIK